MQKFKLENILKVTAIDNEFELEKATAFFNRLRLLVKDDQSLKPLRAHLAVLIEAYESENWSDVDSLSEAQIQESDKAERMAARVEQHIQLRKDLIREKLQEHDLNQNALGEILGHRKNYISELINGVRPFSMEDIKVIHRVLGIDYVNLIIPVIKERTAKRIRIAIKKLNKPGLKLKEEDIELEPA
ncbi:MAG: antitoxin component HigA of HigAB toxin-antitoxin module [Parvicellaceae bacterium]|jgi:antitoxin component HigA of HigAB toxin-antitoxin module